MNFAELQTLILGEKVIFIVKNIQILFASSRDRRGLIHCIVWIQSPYPGRIAYPRKLWFYIAYLVLIENNHRYTCAKNTDKQGGLDSRHWRRILALENELHFKH